MKTVPSRAAIEGLVAKLDGILSHHRILPDGGLRNAAAYSVIDAECPAVKALREARLCRGPIPGAHPSASA